MVEQRFTAGLRRLGLPGGQIPQQGKERVGGLVDLVMADEDVRVPVAALPEGDGLPQRDESALRVPLLPRGAGQGDVTDQLQIGRASCRERV